MLGLESCRWADLTHAYGRASDTPDLLRQLSEGSSFIDDPDCEPWSSLWSSLCHQDDVFDASYAAVPHIVDIAIRSTGPLHSGFFQLPTTIEICRRNGRGPAMPEDLAAAYFPAISRLGECVGAHLADEWDQVTLLSALSALALTKGELRIAEALLNLDSDLIDKLVKLDFD